MQQMHESGFEARRIVAGTEPDEMLTRILPELRRGGVILLPADTIYGLSCRWDSERARERIQALKGPGRLSLFVALVAHRDMAFHYAEPPGIAGMKILDEQWPGPVTAVLRARKDRVPEFCVGPDGTVAFRWPRSTFLQALVRDLGMPLVSTSANRTGEPVASSAHDVWEAFGAGVDLYVDAGHLSGPPSTLIDLTGKAPHLLRLGVHLPGGVSPEGVQPEGERA
jgi:tRNA threonylcarbamoyl adenosine modification protein (Sua5/YciO/YrdC/YwlC family)